MLHLQFSPFPELMTERLVLGSLGLVDLDQIFAIRSDERVSRLLDRPQAKSLDDANQFIRTIQDGVSRNEFILWGIRLQNDTVLVGTICFWNISQEHQRAEIGYELHPDFQGKGIMQEAMARVIDYGFETIHFQKMEAYVSKQNHRSIKVLEKFGFTEDMDAESRKNEKGQINEMLIYSLRKQTL